MAFLIYSRDVGNEMPKVLDTVTQFFGGRRYYDANNVAGGIEANQAGSENVFKYSNQSPCAVTRDL